MHSVAIAKRAGGTEALYLKFASVTTRYSTTWLVESCRYVVATVSPSASARVETQATLQFANRASAIVNCVVRNKCEDMSQVLQSKNEEIRQLKAALYQCDTNGPTRTRSGSLGKLSRGSQYKVLEQQVISLKVYLFHLHAFDFQRTSTEDIHTLLQQALGRERIRVKHLEAQNVRIRPTDDDSGLDFRAALQARPPSAMLGRVLTQRKHFSARLVAAPHRSCKTGERCAPVCTAYQSTSALSSDTVSSCLSQKRSQLDQRGVSRVIQQSQMGCSSVLVCYHPPRRSHAREPVAPKKLMAAGRTIRQLGQQMIRDDDARRQVTKRAEVEPVVVNAGYSDASVAALMQQYSSLAVELGIRQSMVPGSTAAATQVCAYPLVVERTASKQSGKLEHKKVDDEMEGQEPAGMSKTLKMQKRGRLLPSHFGLSGILTAANTVQHKSACQCSTPTGSVSLPCPKASFGLSAILQGSQSAYDRTSDVAVKRPLKQAGNITK